MAGFSCPGLALGIVREITEEGPITAQSLRAAFAGRGSRLDLACCMIGGFIAGGARAMTAPARITQADMTRAAKSVVDAGIRNGRIVMDF